MSDRWEDLRKRVALVVESRDQVAPTIRLDVAVMIDDLADLLAERDDLAAAVVSHKNDADVYLEQRRVVEAERDGLAAEVERLRAVLDDIAVHPLDGERAWRLAVAALTEENRDG